MMLGIASMITLISSCTSDPCEGKTATELCSGKGTLADKNGTCGCNCDAGYEGTKCETETRTKLIGTWTVVRELDNENKEIPGDPKNRVITPSNNTINEVIITNFSGISGATVNASISGNTITIGNQNFGTQFTVSGSGQFKSLTSNSTIDISYTLKRTSDSKTWIYSGIWQK